MTPGKAAEPPLALVRSDPGSRIDGALLDDVDEAYTPMQNREAFQFFDPIVGQGAAVYDMAGELKNGRTVWILARLPRDVRVANGDPVKPYLLLVNQHQRRGRVQVLFTPLRVVCANTLSMALSMGRGLRCDHTPDLPTRLQQAALNLAEIRRRYDELEQSFKSMVRYCLRPVALDAYLNEVLRGAETLIAGGAEMMLHNTAMRLFETGQGNAVPAVRGTLWAAYNAITELADHHLESISRENRLPVELLREERLRSIWFSEAAALKVRAFEIAMRMVRERPPQQPRTCREFMNVPRPERETAWSLQAQSANANLAKALRIRHFESARPWDGHRTVQGKPAEGNVGETTGGKVWMAPSFFVRIADTKPYAD